MRRLLRHIEQALFQHECVVLPGLGAFIKHRVPALLDESKGLIYPAHHTLAFNAALSHNDGILVESYRTAFALSYKRSLKMVEEDVAALQEALRSTAVVSLGALGRLSMDKASQRLTFYPNPDHPFSTESFGLTPVAQLPRSQQVQSLTDVPLRPRREGVIYLPIHLKSVKVAAVIAVAFALSWLIPSHTLTTPTTQHYAGYFSALFEGPVAPAATSPTALPAAIEAEPAVSITPDKASPSAPQSTTPHRMGGLPLMTAVKGEVAYYVVVATFRTPSGVEKWSAGHDLSAYPSAGVLSSGGSSPLYKICIGKYASADEAHQAVRSVAESSLRIPDAWIYKSR